MVPGALSKNRTLPFASAAGTALGAAHGVFFDLVNNTRAVLEIEEFQLCSWSGAPCELTLYSVESGGPCAGLEDYKEEWMLIGAVSVFEDLDAVCLRIRAPVAIKPQSIRGFYLHTPGTSTEGRDACTGACGVGTPLGALSPGRRKNGSVGLSALGAADAVLKVEPWFVSLSQAPFVEIATAKRTPAGKVIYHTEAGRADLLSVPR